MTREELINWLERRTADERDHEASAMLLRDGEAIAALAAKEE